MLTWVIWASYSEISQHHPCFSRWAPIPSLAPRCCESGAMHSGTDGRDVHRGNSDDGTCPGTNMETIALNLKGEFLTTGFFISFEKWMVVFSPDFLTHQNAID